MQIKSSALQGVYFKMSLLGKKLYHERWDNDMWEDSDEAGNTKPLNS